MKIIEAMKQVKDLQRKAEDLVKKVQENCVVSSIETPTYEDQKQQVSEWIQAHSDILKKIMQLRVAIQRTNLHTLVVIELGGVNVEKCIAEWVHRRRDLAKLELSMWAGISDKRIKEGMFGGPGGTPVEIKIVRFYDPKARDEKMSLFSSEPSLIDAKLEIVNAVTDIVE